MNMKITIPRDILFAAMEVCYRSVPPKNTTPTYYQTHIRAKGCVVYLTCAGADASICAIADGARIESPRETLVDSQMFYDVLSKMPCDILSIDVTDAGMVMDDGIRTLRLPVMKPQAYPSVEGADDGKPSVTLKVEDFRRLIESTAYATVETESSPLFGAIRLMLEDGKMVATGIDRTRMAVAKCVPQTIAAEQMDVFIPAKVLLNVARALPAKEACTITLDGNNAVVSSSMYTLRLSTLTGSLPTYSAIIKNCRDGKTVSVHKDSLAQALARAYLFYDEHNKHPVNIAFRKGGMTIEYWGSALGEMKENINADYNGETVESNYSLRFLRDALRHLDSDAVDINLFGKLDPCLITIPDNGDYIAMLASVQDGRERRKSG